ncbi:MAG: polymer-forming cytoskeletal protein [Balneolaceae bacterium]
MRHKQKSKTINSKDTPALTFITETTEIKADMQCDLDIRIAGSVEGNVETKKKVILSDSGKIKGAIISDEADVFGKITGNIRVTNKLILRSTAVVKGEISAKKISIEDGARLTGSLDIGSKIDSQKSESASSKLTA